MGEIEITGSGFLNIPAVSFFSVSLCFMASAEDKGLCFGLSSLMLTQIYPVPHCVHVGFYRKTLYFPIFQSVPVRLMPVLTSPSAPLEFFVSGFFSWRVF